MKITSKSILIFTFVVVAAFLCLIKFSQPQYFSPEYSMDINALRKNAEQGNVLAQYYLGLAYADGTHRLHKNAKEAEKWFFQAVPGLRIAAEQGNWEAEQGLSVLYQNGWSVEKDLEESYFWFLVSVENSPRCQAHTCEKEYGIKLHESRLTPQQSGDARNRAAKWKPIHK